MLMMLLMKGIIDKNVAKEQRCGFLGMLLRI